jgi:hypothetical protein
MKTAHALDCVAAVIGTSLTDQFPFICVPAIFGILKLDCFVTKGKRNGVTIITLPANESSNLNAGSAVTNNFYLLH